MPHVVVGLSGGVDSALSAALLQEAGYQVSGVFMKNWEEDGPEPGHCPQAQDYKDALWVSEKLKIPLHCVNFTAEYWEEVFEDFLKELAAGRTPNPDVACNRQIKFKWMKQYALSLGAHALATGHYANVRTDPDTQKIQLLKGQDVEKDQSYFLHHLTQEQLTQVMFPLGNFDKRQVRAEAKRRQLPVHSKKDSTGICFIGEKRFKTFIEQYLPKCPGSIQTPEGQTLGQHTGLAFYTLGQRQGLQIGGQKNSNGNPWYVAQKDFENNRLIVVQDPKHPLLWSDTLIVKHIHWIAGAPPSLPLRCQGKLRYRQLEESLTLTPTPEGNHQIHFDRAQRAATPGQYLVLYDGNICLGGGVIENIL